MNVNVVWQYLLVAVIFLAFDIVWLKSTNAFYRKHIGHLLREKPDMIAAGLFYVAYMFGIVVFALNPGLDRGSLSYTVTHAALLGALMFATYDLTNQATVKKWSTTVTVVDIIWGTSSTTLVTLIAYLILH